VPSGKGLTHEREVENWIKNKLNKQIIRIPISIISFLEEDRKKHKNLYHYFSRHILHRYFPVGKSVSLAGVYC
jgi:hypothetical protein